MALIAGLLIYFGVGFALALAYNLYRKRRVVESLHMAFVAGAATMLVVYVAAIAIDLAKQDAPKAAKPAASAAPKATPAAAPAATPAATPPSR